MKRWMILLFVLILGPASHAQNTLYPIFEGNLWGYINKTGKVVIKPQFRYALAFSEGLAAVRIEGRYGYIDTTGRVVIAPSYDRGNPFSHGLAQVFRDGKPLFIDKNGHEIFQHSFASIMPFQQHSVTIAGTGTGKYCLIDRQGKMVTDSAFRRIYRLGEAGLFGVYGLLHIPSARDKGEVVKMQNGIIDSNGRFIVRYGRYTDISVFGRHYFSASPIGNVKKKRTGRTVIIDERGKKVIESVPGHYFEKDNSAGFFEGLAVTSWYAETKEKKGKNSHYYNRRYVSVIDIRGQIRISDTTWTDMTPFCRGKAFAQIVNTNKWMLIDRNGLKISDSLYNRVLYSNMHNSPEELFGDGVAYVRLQQGWVGIDTSGAIVQSTDKALTEYDYQLERVGDKIFYFKHLNCESSRYCRLDGFWNTKSNTHLPPMFHRVGMQFIDGIGVAMKDGQYFYINDDGGVVWQGEEVKDSLGTLNIDHMNRGYCYAASEFRKDLAGVGGWAPSDNKAQILERQEEKSNKLILVLADSLKSSWNGYNAIKLFVTNYSGDTLYFNAQDSRLYLTIQAQKENGDWADIEYQPSSWCGNSYHQVFLAPGQYWQFATPLYEGEIKTKLRAKLLYKKQPNHEVDDVVYSNEISGSVNPGQFWYKRKYTPAGMMDPYDD